MQTEHHMARMSQGTTVTIDYEDGEQLAEMCRLLIKHGVASGVHYLDVRGALSEFGRPGPAEPAGLGAVVEDRDGRFWVKVDTVMGCDSWTRADSGTAGADTWVKYERLHAVRVLSPGTGATS